MNPSLSLYPLGEAQTNWLLCAKINKLKKEKKVQLTPSWWLDIQSLNALTGPWSVTEARLLSGNIS